MRAASIVSRAYLYFAAHRGHIASALALWSLLRPGTNWTASKYQDPSLSLNGMTLWQL